MSLTETSHLPSASAPPAVSSQPSPETLRAARAALSGKRIALVGFREGAAELTRILDAAEAFARPFAFELSPSAEVLKPFELIIVNVAGAMTDEWLRAEDLSGVSERALAAAPVAVLLEFGIEPRFPYHKFCGWPGAADELLLRCVLALRPGSPAALEAAPAGSTVVLADDDPSITALVRLTLQRSGMTCEVASNGKDALELISKLRPCAAVLDVGMPTIDGFEVLSRMKSSSETARTRVILLTGCEQESDIVRGFSLGADDYVIKPFNPMELMMRLKRALGRL